jgi:hypothetical protein
VAGHEALDFVGVVRIHDRQHCFALGGWSSGRTQGLGPCKRGSNPRPPAWNYALAVGLAAGHEALDLVSVVRIHDHQPVVLRCGKLFIGENTFPVITYIIFWIKT